MNRTVKAMQFLIPCKNIDGQSDFVFCKRNIRKNENINVSIAAIQFNGLSPRNSVCASAKITLVMIAAG